MLTVYEFGAEAIIYIQEELSFRGHLAKRLLGLPLENGRVISYLPAGMDLKDALAFEDGVFPLGLKTTGVDDKVAEFIATFLQQGSSRYVIFLTWGEHTPWVDKAPYFSCNSFVFFFLTSKSFTHDGILDAMTWAQEYPSVGMLTSLAENQGEIGLAQDVPVEILDELVARTEHLIIGAYDGEGYLIWTRG